VVCVVPTIKKSIREDMILVLNCFSVYIRKKGFLNH
jgi:hypothetical protein